jgi:hypothetical protein
LIVTLVGVALAYLFVTTNSSEWSFSKTMYVPGATAEGGTHRAAQS